MRRPTMRTFYDEITKIAGNVVSVKAQGIGYDDLAVVTTGRGTSLAQVIRIEDDQVSLQIF
ncbi:MAG: V-type ATP synthase subunit B, partial [Planctomycetota bacterium]